MIYGRDQINHGSGGGLGFGPGYTSGNATIVGQPPDPSQLNAQQQQQQAIAQQQAMAQQQAIAAQQAMAQQQAVAQQMQQQQAPIMHMPEHVDVLWSKLIDRLASGPLAQDSKLFADMSAVVIQSFGPASLAQQSLKAWASLYSQMPAQQQQAQQQVQQQLQQQMQSDIAQAQQAMVAAEAGMEPPMTVPQQQTAQQQQVSGPFVAGRWRRF